MAEASPQGSQSAHLYADLPSSTALDKPGKLFTVSKDCGAHLAALLLCQIGRVGVPIVGDGAPHLLPLLGLQQQQGNKGEEGSRLDGTCCVWSPETAQASQL